MRYAIVVDGVVSNVIEADEEFVDTCLQPEESAVQMDERCIASVGWTYDGVDFIAPEASPGEGGSP